jgi:hypothetical protein
MAVPFFHQIRKLLRGSVLGPVPVRSGLRAHSTLDPRPTWVEQRLREDSKPLSLPRGLVEDDSVPAPAASIRVSAKMRVRRRYRSTYE